MYLQTIASKYQSKPRPFLTMGKCCTFHSNKYIQTAVSALKDVKMQKTLHIKYTVVWNFSLAAYEK